MALESLSFQDGTISFDDERDQARGLRIASITFTSFDGDNQWAEFLERSEVLELRAWLDALIVSGYGT